MKKILCKAASTCKSHPILSSLATLGAIVVADKVFTVIKGVWKYTLRPSKDLAKRYKTANSWAMITGASSGIGFSHAKHLARLGFNIILIARNAKNLETKRDEILAELGDKAPDIKIFPFDFSKAFDLNYYQQLEMFISDKEIAILVNNVGADYTCKFAEVPVANLLDMLNVNIISLTYLTRMIVPSMLKRSKRSAIVNISTAFTATYVPNNCLYICTKTYMNSLMRHLHTELKDKVDVLTCLTGEVSTPSNEVKAIWHTPPDVVVKGYLSALGYDTFTAGILRHVFYGMYIRSCFGNRYKEWIKNAMQEKDIRQKAH